MKKRILSTFLFVLVLMTLVSCGARKNPTDATLLFFKSMRSGKYEDAGTCVLGEFDADRIKEEYESLGGSFLDKMRDFEYEVTNVEENETTATLSVKVAYYDLKPIYEDVMKGLLDDVKTDETVRNMDDDEISKEAMTRLNQRIDEATDLKRVEKSFNVLAKNTDDNWKIDIDNSDMKEVISANLSNY